VSVADTLGTAVPTEVADMVMRAVPWGVPVGVHLHDTRGTALANVAAALDAGIRCFDSSAGGTGGCPYAPGAAGNLATEDLVYFLDASGWEHGVDLAGVLAAARFAAGALGKPLATKVGQAGGWDAFTGGPAGPP
jgi:hydroxymethylglutaryl-CoA lyase